MKDNKVYVVVVTSGNLQVFLYADWDDAFERSEIVKEKGGDCQIFTEEVR